MAFVVGEVITKFEAEIKKFLSAIDKVEKTLKRVTGQKYNIDLDYGIDIVKGLEEGFSGILERIDDIVSAVETATSDILSAAAGVSRQIYDVADSTVTRVQKSLGAKIETWYSRSIVALILAGLVSFNSAVNDFAKNFILQTGLITKSVFLWRTAQEGIAAVLGRSLYHLEWMVKSTGQLKVLFGGITGTLATFVSRTALFSGYLLVWNVFLKETVILAKRLLGFGFNMVTPLQRITRLTTTLDVSIHQVGYTTGQLIKTISLGIATFAGPFSGIIAGIPFINSAVTTILNTGAKFRLTFLSFFGSARSQLSLILLQGKEVALKILPLTYRLIKQIGPGIKYLGNLIGKFIGRTFITRFFKLRNIRKNILQVISDLKLIPGQLKGITESIRIISGVLKSPAFAFATTQTANLRKMIPTIDAVKGSYRVLGEETKKAQASANAFNSTLQNAGQLALTGIAEKSGQAIIKILDFDKAYKKAQTWPRYTKALPQELQRIVAWFDTLVVTVKKGGDPTKFLTKFAKGLDAFRRRFRLKGKQMGEDLLKALEKATVDPARFEAALKGMDDFLKKVGVKGKSRGAQLVKLLAQGMKGETETAKQAISQVAKVIMSFLPQSLPLAGPLRGILKAGTLIPRYIAQGMLSAQSVIVRAMQIITGLIARPLASLKKLGDLVSFERITSEATDIKRLSERLGISVEVLSTLGYAAKTAGTDLQTLSYSFVQLQRQINNTTSEEVRKNFADLGIDIDEIRKTAAPTTELFYKLSNVIRDGGWKAEEALQRLGVVGGSSLINLLQKGELGAQGIKALQREAIDTGAVVTREFADMSQKITVFLGKVDAIKDSLKRDVIATILPAITDAADRIFKFIKQYRTQIKAVTLIAVDAVKLTFSIIRDLVLYVIKEPQKAFDLLINVIRAFYDFIIDLASQAFRILTGAVWDFVKEVALIAFETSKGTISRFFQYVGELLKINSGTIKVVIFKLIYDLYAIFGRIFTFVPEMIVKITNFIILEIPAFVPKLIKVLGLALRDIYNYLKTKVEIIVLDLVKRISDLIQRIPLVRQFLEKLGLGNFLEMAKIISQKQAELQADLANRTTQTGQAVKSMLADVKAKITGFLPSMDDLQKGYFQLLKDMAKQSKKAGFGAIFSEAFQEAKENITKIIEITGKAKEKIFDTKELEKLQETTKKLVDGLNNAVKGTPLEGIVEKYKGLFESWDKIVNKIEESNKQLRQKIEEPEEPKSGPPKLLERTFDFSPLLDGMESALKIFAQKGKVTMQELAAIGEEQFSSAFSSIMDLVKGEATTALSQGIIAITGMTSEAAGKIGQAAISGIMAIGSLLISRLQDKVETTHEAIKNTIEKTEQLRGVIAGETTIGILEIGNRLALLNRPMVTELRGIRELVAEIRDILQSGSLGYIGSF